MTGPAILSVRRIWSRAAHNAFTDLARFQGAWYCAFREAEGHAGSTGRVQIISSPDGVSWQRAVLFTEPGADLRDPKLCVGRGGRLMLLMGATAAGAGQGWTRQPRVSFSRDGREWTPPRPILTSGDWLWRVTWFDGRAYGVSYRAAGSRRWIISLYAGDDGIDYHRVCQLPVTGLPNESTLRFLPDGRALMLVRREGGDKSAWIGRSRPPFMRWTWRSAGQRIGGPNFIVLPSGALWGAGRWTDNGEHRTVIAHMGPSSWKRVLELPSAGDCSYPGLVWHRGLLWVSYYSSHEGKASIYLARIRVPRD